MIVAGFLPYSGGEEITRIARHAKEAPICIVDWQACPYFAIFIQSSQHISLRNTDPCFVPHKPLKQHRLKRAYN